MPGMMKDKKPMPYKDGGMVKKPMPAKAAKGNEKKAMPPKGLAMMMKSKK